MKTEDKHKFRFVVLHHTGWPGRADHYDLMLQTQPGNSDDDRVLKTFTTADDVFPEGLNETLLQIDDHRRAYLHFEGNLSGQRGRIARADEGDLYISDSPDISSGATLVLRGLRLNGPFQLIASGGGHFLFKKHQ